MSRKVNYFEAQRQAPNRMDTTLSIIVSDYIPTTLSALETRSRRSFWTSDADFARAYNEIARQQWELLVDATDRIVSEIRALREGTATPLVDQNPALNPFNIELTSLRDINLALRGNEGSAHDALVRIEQLLTAANEGDAEALAELLRIGAVIAGAI